MTLYKIDNSRYGYAAGGNTPPAHQCNCIGCCQRCGTCRTWPGHTPEYCDLLVKQRAEREDMLGNVAIANGLHLRARRHYRIADAIRRSG